MYYHLNPVSNNRKTGPMPVATISSDSCTRHCPYKDKECYALYHFLGMFWKKLSKGEIRKSTDWNGFIRDVKYHCRLKMWRYGQAGELPGDGDNLDREKCLELALANRRVKAKGMCYTHYPITKKNAEVVRMMNTLGFVVNFSADSRAEVDQAIALGCPVVTVADHRRRKPIKTADGNHVACCPNAIDKRIQCMTCRICWKSDRKVAIYFPGHGQWKKNLRVI